MVDTIYFDNWNTIVQAPNLMKRGSSTKIFHQYLLEQGINVDYEAFAKAYRRITSTRFKLCEEAGHREPDYLGIIEDSFKAVGVKDAKTHSVEAWSLYLSMWVDDTTFFPGVQELLMDLKDRYKLGVITNYMDGPTCRKIFEKLDYYSIFDSLVVSHELGYMKPAEILFRTAMRETCSKPESSVMVGDTYSADIVGGNRVGMKTILVDIYDTQQQHYGDCGAVIKRIHDLPLALRKIVPY